MTENRGDTSCPQRDSAEREGYAEVPRTFRTLWKERGDAAPDLLERMLDRNNLNRAYKRVRANKGAPGIDGMTVDEALPYLRENRDVIIGSVLGGKYTPSPVRRVEIPKPDGGVRLLGIPTVKDRIIQQAFTQKLVPIYEPLFAEGSYGYRPGKSCQDAIRKVAEYANEGYTQAVVLDLSKYFDTLNHNLLLNILRRQIGDERVIQIIKRWLKSGVMENGVVTETGEGSPQGGVISPLLANIYLNEFDQEYTRRGVRFVRYADDIVLFAKSRRAAQRLLEGAVRFLTQTLKLKVNEEKSRITSVYSQRFQYLGFTLGATRNGAQIRIHPKKKQKIKRELKQLTKRNKGLSVRVIMQTVERKMRGWLQYYSLACMKGFIADLAEWLRHRYRMIIWKQWKRAKTKMRNLRKPPTLHMGRSGRPVTARLISLSPTKGLRPPDVTTLRRPTTRCIQVIEGAVCVKAHVRFCGRLEARRLLPTRFLRKQRFRMCSQTNTEKPHETRDWRVWAGKQPPKEA